MFSVHRSVCRNAEALVDFNVFSETIYTWVQQEVERQKKSKLTEITISTNKQSYRIPVVLAALKLSATACRGEKKRKFPVKSLLWHYCTAGMVAHPVTQVMASQLQLDILDLSKVASTCWGCTNTSNGLGLRMVKDSDMQLVLGMNERRKAASACV